MLASAKHYCILATLEEKKTNKLTIFLWHIRIKRYSTDISNLGDHRIGVGGVVVLLWCWTSISWLLLLCLFSLCVVTVFQGEMARTKSFLFMLVSLDCKPWDGLKKNKDLYVCQDGWINKNRSMVAVSCSYLGGWGRRWLMSRSLRPTFATNCNPAPK